LTFSIFGFIVVTIGCNKDDGGREAMKSLVQSGYKLLFILCFVAASSSQAFPQAVEVEPNDPCAEAQGVGAIDVTGVFSVQGSLDTPPVEPDIDFYRFSATPGAQVVADHEGRARC
jgi:hypothetical protein